LILAFAHRINDIGSMTDPVNLIKFKTCRRFNDVGHAHALTFSTFKRQKFLSKERSRRWLADAITLAREKQSFHVWAYVFMFAR
jgi:hypothetical protein